MINRQATTDSLLLMNPSIKGICLVCFFEYGDVDLNIGMVGPNIFRKRTKTPSVLALVLGRLIYDLKSMLLHNLAYDVALTLGYFDLYSNWKMALKAQIFYKNVKPTYSPRDFKAINQNFNHIGTIGATIKLLQ
jgi:hypothetical protein